MQLTRFALPLLAACMLALPCATGAQSPPPPASIPPPVPPASAEAHKEAAALAAMNGVDKLSQQLLGIMRNQMIQLVMRAGAKAPANDPTRPPELMKPEDAAKIVDDVLMPDFAAQQADLNTQIIDVWGNNFSVEDLEGLRAFYATPLGKKLVATLPAVTQQGMAAGQAWGQRVYQASVLKHKDALIARGLRF